MNILILASTFRHYYLSAGLALSDADNSYHLVFIDQLHGKSDNKLFKAVEELAYPFASVDCLPTKAELGSKRLSRKYGFKILKSLINDLVPDEIITGNDRRVEFQYSMAYAKSINEKVQGGFIDDGTGSYITFQDLDSFKLFTDKYIDTFFKKVMYGTWYERPERFGSSSWINKCYLTHPDQSPVELSGKCQIKLNPEMFLTEKAYVYFLQVLNALSVSKQEKVEPNSTLVILPHSSILLGIYGSKENFFALIKELGVVKDKLYFKYHPRELGDPLELNSLGTLLMSYVPAELYFSTSQFNNIVGDVSTALLSAKWLKPNAKVNYFPIHSKFTKRVETLFNEVSINALKGNYIK